jgi:hypothetical protein
MNKQAIRYAANQAGFAAPLSKEIIDKFELFLVEYFSLEGFPYTPEQFAKWEQEIREDERKKTKKALYKYCQAWKCD